MDKCDYGGAYSSCGGHHEKGPRLRDLPRLPEVAISGKSSLFTAYEGFRGAPMSKPRENKLWEIVGRLGDCSISTSEYRDLLLLDMANTFTFELSSRETKDHPAPRYEHELNMGDWYALVDAAPPQTAAWEKYLDLVALSIAQNYLSGADSYGYRYPGFLRAADGGSALNSRIAKPLAAAIEHFISSGRHRFCPPRVSMISEKVYRAENELDMNTIYLVIRD